VVAVALHGDFSSTRVRVDGACSNVADWHWV